MTINLRAQWEEANRILLATTDTANELLAHQTKAACMLAKKEITAGQKELRLLKKTITDEQRVTRQEFQEQTLAIRGTGQTAGFLLGAKGRRVMAAGRGFAQRDLQSQKIDAMAEFDRTKAHIDGLILQLDRSKSQIDLALARQAAA